MSPVPSPSAAPALRTLTLATSSGGTAWSVSRLEGSARRVPALVASRPARAHPRRGEPIRPGDPSRRADGRCGRVARMIESASAAEDRPGVSARCMLLTAFQVLAASRIDRHVLGIALAFLFPATRLWGVFHAGLAGRSLSGDLASA